MMQPLRSTRSLIATIATGGTAQLVSATSVPCRMVFLKARSTNTGTIKILGVNGTTIDSDGYSLAAGNALPTLWICDLNQLAFLSPNTGDVLEILYSN